MANTRSGARPRQISPEAVGKGLLNSLILISSSVVLLLVSCVAFLFFYHHNVPAIGVHRTVHLQYHTQPNPHATIDLAFSTSELATSQPYDIVVELHLPNTVSNHEIGNFMIELDMLSTASESIVTSARPAIMEYSSPMIDTMSTLASSGPILLGFKRESQVLRVPLLENYAFEAGWLTNPAQARIEIHAPTLKVYSCQVHFHTRLGGLPWFLYHYKITSLVVFATLFWFSSMLFMFGSWAIVTFVAYSDRRSTPSSYTSRSSRVPGSSMASGAFDSDSEGVDPSMSSATSEARFPRVTPGERQARQRSSVATSSVETASFFQFDGDEKDRREGSVETDATTIQHDTFDKSSEWDDSSD